MKELIRITEHEGKQAVSARELHEFLESKQDFSTWVKNRIKKYGLIENQDYVSLHSFVEREIGATQRIEYALTIPCAKELSMVEANAKGKQARRYFIACEEKLKEISQKPLSLEEMFMVQAKLNLDQSKRIDTVESQVKLLEAKATTRPDYFTIAGYATLQGMNVNLKQASSLGQKASKLCKDRGIETGDTPDPRFGKVKTYPTSVLDEVFNLVIN